MRTSTRASSTSTSPVSRPGPTGGEIGARALAAAGLGIDAYVHLMLAPDYDGVATTISQGALFRVEAAAAALAAVLVLVLRGRAVAALAMLVAAAGLAAVLAYRYLNIGAIGPLPDMYEPVWYTEKTLSAIAEAVATLTAAALLTRAHRAGSILPRRPRSRS